MPILQTRQNLGMLDSAVHDGIGSELTTWRSSALVLIPLINNYSISQRICIGVLVLGFMWFLGLFWGIWVCPAREVLSDRT